MMNRDQKIDIMMEYISEHAGTIPGYLWDDYREAVDMAFRKIEQVEKEEPQTGGAVRDSTVEK